MKMRNFQSASLTMTLDDAGRVTQLIVPGGGNQIRQPLPFARLEYFEPQPAFTNEWIHPLCVQEPVYVQPSSAWETPEGFVLDFADGVQVKFSVEATPEGLVIILSDIQADGRLPSRIRFAWFSLVTDGDTAVTGMALDPIVEGGALPGIYPEQWAQAYAHTGYIGRRWALTGASKVNLQEQMRRITKLYTTDIPWMPCAGAFASQERKMQGSYMMSYGDYLPGSLAPSNLEEWIHILHAIGLTQVDFHGAEGKNFTFGDFEPNRDIYPEGRKSLKAVVDRLHQEGIDAILHTYSALIGDNSSLVKPVPDRRLGYNRVFTLAADIDASADVLPILESTAEVSLVHTGHYNSSTYVVWDDEIVQFTSLDGHALCGCIRGALGTNAAPHRAGTPGRNLKRKYNIFAPDVGGPLFDLVARNTAACANECGFDAFYFDALEGAHVLEGRDFEDYYCTRFVYQVAKYVGRPMGMEMSTMFHNLWYVRSRMGTWDRPSRAHKRYIERHAEVNRLAQERSMLPQNLGWWYYGQNLPSAPSEWERITTDVYETMGRLAAAYDFSLSFQGLTLQAYQSSPELQRYGDRIRRWEQLRLSGSLSKEERAAIASVECHMEPEGIYEASYPQAVALLRGGSAEISICNPFGVQKPFLIRLEPLYSRAESAARQEKSFDVNAMLDPGAVKSEDSSGAPTEESWPLGGCTAQDLLVFTSRTVQASAADEDSPYGPALRLTAKGEREIGVARFERRFEVPVNFSKQYGCGVWVYGDGRGEVLNLQLRSHFLYSDGLDEKLIVVDFIGWRYFELIESSSSETMNYLWPYYHRQLDKEGEFKPLTYEPETSDWPDSMYLESSIVTGNPHHLTASTPDFSRIAFAAVWMNNLPKGVPCEVKIAGWHTFFTQAHTLSNITVESIPVCASGESESILLSGALLQDSIAEYSDGTGTPGLGEEGRAVPSWFTSDAHSVPIDGCSVSGSILLQPGENRLRVTADGPDGARIRVVCGVCAEEPLISWQNAR